MTAPSVLRGYLSDNASGASPEILDAVVAASTGPAAPYGNDDASHRVTAQFAEVFEHDVDVFPVGTGSAANGIALAALTPPWGSVLCQANAHIDTDEAGAPEFFTNGAKIVPLAGHGSRMAPDSLRAAVQRRRGDVHSVQPSVLSLTQATEAGSVYGLDQLGELGAVAHDAGLRVHMDGARFANALVVLGCSPAEMTWRCGIDVVSFGATKNGALTADAIVSFDPTLRTELAYRHKRGGQLTSKMRFQTAQLGAYLTDDLWLRTARHANDMARRLRDGLAQAPGVTVFDDLEANILFCRFPSHLIDRLLERGYGFYHDRWEPGVVRLVTSFAHRPADIDDLVNAVHEITSATSTA